MTFLKTNAINNSEAIQCRREITDYQQKCELCFFIYRHHHVNCAYSLY